MNALKVYVEYSVLCDCCGYREATPLKKAATMFRKMGWVVKDNIQLCPECKSKPLEEIKSFDLLDLNQITL